MKRLFSTMLVAGLMLGVAVAHAGQSGNCSPQGNWYGYNTIRDIWLITINRSRPESFTMVMDWGPNGVVAEPPGVLGASDFRGELVKTGPRSYDLTVMALWRADEAILGVPFLLGFCELEVELTGCNSLQMPGEDVCDFYAFLSHDQDPFEDGFPNATGAPSQAFFKRMPMSYPAP